jgi:hypothetical protein
LQKEGKRKLRNKKYEKNKMFLGAAQCHRHEGLSIIKAPVRAGHADIYPDNLMISFSVGAQCIAPISGLFNFSVKGTRAIKLWDSTCAVCMFLMINVCIS